MKIFLLGDYSSFHLNLQAGLKNLGCNQVVLASNGDSFKKLSSDIQLPDFSTSHKLEKIKARVNLLTLLSNISGFDVVQIVNPSFLVKPYFPAKYLINQLKKNNGSVFLSACGSDPFYWRVAQHKMRYGPFDDILKYDLASRPNHWDRDDVFDTCNYIASTVNAIIPIAYDYSCGYHGFSNLSPCIPLPFSLDNQPAISKP